MSSGNPAGIAGAQDHATRRRLWNLGASSILRYSEKAPEIVTSLFDRGAHYTLGMRAYYLAIPVTLWFFGPIWMLVAAIVLVIVLYRLDHIPGTPE